MEYYDREGVVFPSGSIPLSVIKGVCWLGSRFVMIGQERLWFMSFEDEVAKEKAAKSKAGRVVVEELNDTAQREALRRSMERSIPVLSSASRGWAWARLICRRGSLGRLAVVHRGPLLKRSVLRWKRRFFLLLSSGHLVRYQTKDLNKFVGFTDISSGSKIQLQPTSGSGPSGHLWRPSAHRRPSPTRTDVPLNTAIHITSDGPSASITVALCRDRDRTTEGGC